MRKMRSGLHSRFILGSYIQAEITTTLTTDQKCIRTGIEIVGMERKVFVVHLYSTSYSFTFKHAT